MAVEIFKRREAELGFQKQSSVLFMWLFNYCRVSRASYSAVVKRLKRQLAPIRLKFMVFDFLGGNGEMTKVQSRVIPRYSPYR